MTGRLARYAYPILLTGMLLGCQDPNGPGISEKVRVSHQARLVSASVPLSTGNIYNPAMHVPLQASFSAPTLVRITVSGVTRIYHNTDDPQASPPFKKGDLEGTVGPLGYWFSGWCPMRVSVYYSGTGYALPPSPVNPCPFGLTSTPTSVSWTAVVSGDGFAHREGAPGCGCPTAQEYYDANHTVTVEEIDGDLTLTASATTILPAQTVTFTANSTAPELPLTAVGWRWVPDTGQPSTPCGGATTCAIAPIVSGSMTCNGLIGGVPKSKARHVNVVPCPTEDSILDNPKVRLGMVQGLTSSGFFSLPSDQTTEHGGYVWQGPDGTIFTTDAGLGSSNGCHLDYPSQVGPPPVPGAIIIGYWHTHPHHAGDHLYGCRGGPADGVPWAQYPGQLDPQGHPLPQGVEGGTGNGCGSAGDWGATASGYPVYIIHGDGWVCELPPDVPTPNRPNNKPKAGWKKPCDWRQTPGSAVPPSASMIALGRVANGVTR